MKITGIVHYKETQTTGVEASSYDEGRLALEQRVPEGWQLQHIRTEQ